MVLFGFRRRERTSSLRPIRPRLELSHTPDVIYAIGDVHGCLEKLLKLEQRLVEDADQFSGTKLIVMLGDYIDRGSDSAGVIEHLCAGPPDGMKRLCLAGNHEALLLDSLADPRMFEFWMDFGAQATLLSYGLDIHHLRTGMRFDTERIATELRQAIPEAHLAFIEALPASLSTPEYFFAHAGVRPGTALAEQKERDLMWIRDSFIRYEGAPFDKKIVHGHTPAPKPVVTPIRIGIDTGAYLDGKLTAARLVPNAKTLFLSL
jgi:serine/threonine protein phosphatase 1